MIDDAARIAAAVDAAAIEAAVNAGKIEAAVDAAAALIGLPIAPAHRPGVLQFHALAASMAQVLMAQPLARDDESGAVFHPVEPAARDDTPPETVRVCRLDSQPLWESEAREGKRQHTEDFSPSEAALAAAGACGIAEAVCRGASNAAEQVDAALARIQATDGRINAFTEVLAERARRRAAAIDALPADAALPLRGVPFAVKNLFDIEGLATLAGSKIELDAPPATQDALLVRRVEAAGAILVGAAVFDRCEPLLRTLASSLHRVGARIGDAARVKLVNNLLAGIHLVAGAQAMALGAKLGLDARLLVDVINASSGASWMFADRMPRALANDFAPRARTAILAKDMRLAIEMAEAAGVEVPLGEQALAAFRRAIEAGWGDWDDAVVARAAPAS